MLQITLKETLQTFFYLSAVKNYPPFVTFSNSIFTLFFPMRWQSKEVIILLCSALEWPHFEPCVQFFGTTTEKRY